METNKIINGDCIEELRKLPDNSVDAIVTDPPYGLEFMGKEWDKLWDNRKDSEDAKLEGTGNIRNAPTYKAGSQAQDFHTSWAKECLRVLKPGGHLLAFGGSRTYHRLASGVEDAGFEIRDQIMWIYGSGFPKSMNIGKAIDKMQGNEREVVGERICDDIRGNDLMYRQDGKSHKTLTYQFTKGNSEWEGWGTGLKPAHEPIVVARKPIAEKNVALNVLKYGTGGINIDASRIGVDKHIVHGGGSTMNPEWGFNEHSMGQINKEVTGRFPANIILECTCDEKEHNIECPCGIMDSQSGNSNSNGGQSYSKTSEIYGEYSNDRIVKGCGFGDKGGASRYFQNIHTDENCPCRLLDEQAPNTGAFAPVKRDKRDNNVYGDYEYFGDNGKSFREDFGGASRFFYCAKSGKSERNFGCEDLPLGEAPGSKRSEPAEGRQSALGNQRANYHPTVKPVKLMEYLINLVSREGSIILDPFLGSGTTAIACLKKNRQFIGIEKNPEYIQIAEARIKPYLSQTKLPNLSVSEVVKHE